MSLTQIRTAGDETMHVFHSIGSSHSGEEKRTRILPWLRRDLYQGAPLHHSSPLPPSWVAQNGLAAVSNVWCAKSWIQLAQGHLKLQSGMLSQAHLCLCARGRCFWAGQKQPPWTHTCGCCGTTSAFVYSVFCAASRWLTYTALLEAQREARPEENCQYRV